MTAISDKYAQLGGAAGFLGVQITAEISAADGGLKQDFRNGTIYWHSRTVPLSSMGQSVRAGWFWVVKALRWHIQLQTRQSLMMG